MEVSTNYNSITTQNGFNALKATTEARDINVEQPKVKADQEIKMAKIDETVMMDLKDVQNFLYMLIGSEIKVHDDNGSRGSMLNLSA